MLIRARALPHLPSFKSFADSPIGARRTYRSVLSEPTLVIPGVTPSVDPLKSALDVPAAVENKKDIEDESENGDAMQTDDSDSETSRKRKRSNSGGRDRKRKKKRR